ncbi:MAG: hypothetical protein WCX70_00265 [Candidatus Paceibacterota bacterium]|jgi:hypothetical protein
MFNLKKKIALLLLLLLLIPLMAMGVTDSAQVGLEVVSSGISGCTDPEANNYNSAATIDDGSCEYGSGGPVDPEDPEDPEEDILGCTDSEALNYNPIATIDDGSCEYPTPSNVSNFSVYYDETETKAFLSWENPIEDFVFVRIVRLEDGISGGPDEGILIYQGDEQLAQDSTVEIGKKYFYTAFTRNNQGEYSSGAVTFLDLVEKEEEEIEEEIEEEDEKEEGGEDSSEGGGRGDSGVRDFPDPFAKLSLATSTPLLESSWFLRLLQPGEPVKLFNRGEMIYIKGGKSLTLEMNYKVMPKVLKTIGVTFVDINNLQNTTAVILRASADKRVYQATLSPFEYGGVYEMYIYLIDYDNQTVVPTRGEISVSGRRHPGAELLSLASEAAVPTAMASGLAVGFFPSFADIFNYLIRLFGYLFGRRKKDKPWGTVYDSVTKRPLDPAYVSVEEVGNGKEISSAITDIDGRFGFFLPAGNYALKANKTHYQFPSQKLTGREADELYNNLYFGQPIITEGEEVINLNIPMDPIGFDWNEFAKTKTDFFRFYSKRELWRNRIFNIIFFLGFILSFYTLVFQPSILNIILVLLYISVYIFNKLWRAKYRPHRLYKKETNEPMPFSIIRLFLPEVDQQIKNVVTDQMGNFYVLVRPGVYYFTVEEKMPDGSYQKVYQSEPMELKKGVFVSDISV